MNLTASFFAFVATILFMFVLRPLAREIGLLDVPGGRKRHELPIPLVGGLAMSLGIGLASTLVDHGSSYVSLILAGYLLVFVGTIDDRFDLPAGVRLIAQAAAAMLIVYGANIQVLSLEESFFVTVNLGPLAPLFTLLFIITMINAFNVIDGIDGLAGGISLISLGALAVVGYGSQVFGLSVIAVGAVAAFLVFNWPMDINRQIRCFMGDAGSTFLGLMIAAIGITVSQSSVTSVAPVVGLWLVAVPVYDLFSAAIRRVMQGRSPFAPDHEHLHHALSVAGLSRRVTLAFMVLWALTFAAIGLAGHYAGAHDGLLLIGWLGGLALYYQVMRRPEGVARIIKRVLEKPRFRWISS